MRLLPAAGLHPLSRLHLAMGVMSYLASPLWLLFLLSGMALALHAYLVPPDYFVNRWSLFPDWPRIDPERAMALFGLCILVLYAPKLFGAAAFLRDRTSRGIRIRTLPGVLAEIVLSALIAPIMMMVQTSSVIQILTGRDSGWKAQARDADRVPWSLLWRFHRRHVLAGLVLAVAAGAISWRLLAWMSPALLGLVFAAPVSAFVGSARAGRGLGRLGLLTTPEERAPPPLAAAAEREAAALRARAPAPKGLGPLLADPDALARHLAWLDAATSRRPGDPDAALAGALLRLADGADPGELPGPEAYAVLASPPTIRRLARNRPLGPEVNDL
jgi:membrane glycosyltransferase